MIAEATIETGEPIDAMKSRQELCRQSLKRSSGTATTRLKPNHALLSRNSKQDPAGQNFGESLPTPARRVPNKRLEAMKTVKPSHELPPSANKGSKKAISGLKSKDRMPSSIPTKNPDEAARRAKSRAALPHQDSNNGGKAKACMKSRAILPAPTNTSDAATRPLKTKPPLPHSDFVLHHAEGIEARAATILRVRQLYREWKSLNQTVQIANKRRLAFIKECLGFAEKTRTLRIAIEHAKATGAKGKAIKALEADAKKQRNQIAEDAATVIKCADRAKEVPEHLAAALSALKPFLMDTKMSGEVFEREQNRRVKELEKAMATLPGAAYVDSIRGFGMKSFANVIGEAGDLSAYSNPGKLWKRFGLHVFEGKACSTWANPIYRGEAEALSADQWKDVGYSPQRRATMYAIGECVIRQSPKDEPPTEMKIIYNNRRAFKAIENDMHAHRDAMRYMVKRLLRDLWKAWNADSRKAAGELS